MKPLGPTHFPGATWLGYQLAIGNLLYQEAAAATEYYLCLPGEHWGTRQRQKMVALRANDAAVAT